MRSDDIPEETKREWIRFLATKPTIADQTSWITLKAAEIGWDFYDLSIALVHVAKPQLDEPDPEPAN